MWQHNTHQNLQLAPWDSLKSSHVATYIFLMSVKLLYHLLPLSILQVHSTYTTINSTGLKE